MKRPQLLFTAVVAGACLSAATAFAQQERTNQDQTRDRNQNQNQTRDQQDQRQHDQQAREQQTREQQQERRLMLGVAFEKNADFSHGLPIAGVRPGSPAEEANLRAGDVIVGIAGENVTSPQQLDKLIRRHSAGEKADLTIMRNGERKQVQVSFIEMGQQDEFGDRRGPQDRQGFDRYGSRQSGYGRQSRGWLGITLNPEKIQGQQGVAIERVYPAGPAAMAGLDNGDRILQLDKQQITSSDQLLQMLSQKDAGDTVVLVVASDGQQRNVNARLEDASVFNVGQMQQGQMQQGQAQQGQMQDGQMDQYSQADNRNMWRDPSGFNTEIPEMDMMLEQHRRFAEQHERLEQLLNQVRADLQEIKQQLNARGNQ